MVDLGVGALGWASVLGKDGDGSPAAAIWALDLILDALNVILSFLISRVLVASVCHSPCRPRSLDPDFASMVLYGQARWVPAHSWLDRGS
jgi:hypothetical protein